MDLRPAGREPDDVPEAAFSEVFAAEPPYFKVVRYHARHVEPQAFDREIDYGNVGALELADGRDAGRIVAQRRYHAVAAPFGYSAAEPVVKYEVPAPFARKTRYALEPRQTHGFHHYQYKGRFHLSVLMLAAGDYIKNHVMRLTSFSF